MDKALQKSHRQPPFRLSFTFGGLLVPESQVVAVQYLQSGSWPAARLRIEEKNLLQKTRRETGFRYFREIRDRLQQASPWEIDMVAHGRDDQRRAVLLVLMCRYYPLLHQFVRELIVWKYMGRDLHLARYEVAAFFERKGEQYTELSELAESSRQKLQQVAVRMLLEARVLMKSAAAGTKTGERGFIIRKPDVPLDVVFHYGNQKDYAALELFLIGNQEIKKLIGE